MQNHSDTAPKGSEDSEKQDTIDGPGMSLSQLKLIVDQENDPEIAPLFKFVLPPVKLDKVRNGVLIQKWSPPNVATFEEWSAIHQIVLPKVYQSDMLKLAHESSGINKSYSTITKHFY